MTIRVLAPVAGLVIALTEVPDPVFAGGIVGPGLAIDPLMVENSEVVSPVSGTVAKAHPHAFMVTTDEGPSVLVHLGLDTVQLDGAGFTLHIADGDRVSAGQLAVTWSPKEIQAGGRSPISPVIAIEATNDAIYRLAQPGDDVAAGGELFDWI